MTVTATYTKFLTDPNLGEADLPRLDANDCVDFNGASFV